MEKIQSLDAFIKATRDLANVEKELERAVEDLHRAENIVTRLAMKREDATGAYCAALKDLKADVLTEK